MSSSSPRDASSAQAALAAVARSSANASASGRTRPESLLSGGAPSSPSTAASSSSSNTNNPTSRLIQSRAPRPLSANVGLDLSSASAADRPSGISGASSIRSPNAAASASTSAARPSVATASVGTSQHEMWRSSAAKRAEKAWAIQTEKALQTDPKFKKYVAVVERSLASFDSVSEWADFIAFLARLLKTFQSHANYNVIPRKLIVAKRLSQCLNPALPSGVHQRALEVYSHILAVIGPDGLRRDLHIWSPGLLPFFQFASTSTKPTLLSILDKHYLPLQEDLRPVLKALLLGLLPGLEEETGEFFDNVLVLLDHIARSVSQSFFLQNLWLVLITAPPVRLAALNYLSRRVPSNLHDAKTAPETVGHDLGLMVRALSHALEDENLLVRRSVLDLLTSHFRLDCSTFRTALKLPDRVLLVRSAIAIVLRRDLSLNRRLYTWLLGTDESEAGQQAYLKTNALDLVHRALGRDFVVPTSSAANESVDLQRPYRVILSLLDKWEIGQPLTNVVVLDMLSTLAAQVEALGAGLAKGISGTETPANEEVAMSGRMLFEIIDPLALYRQFYFALRAQFEQDKQIVILGGESASIVERSDDKLVGDDDEAPPPGILRTVPTRLLAFVLSFFDIHDDETRQIHLPVLLAVLLELLDTSLSKGDAVQTMSAEEQGALLNVLQTVEALVALIPVKVFVCLEQPQQRQDASDSTDAKETPPSFLALASTLYSNEGEADEATWSALSFQRSANVSRLLSLSADVALKCAPARSQHLPRHRGADKIYISALGCVGALLDLLDRGRDSEVLGLLGGDAIVVPVPWRGSEEWKDDVLETMRESSSFDVVQSSILALVSGTRCRALKSTLHLDSRADMSLCVERVLFFLSPTAPLCHLPAVRLFWALHRVSHAGHIESSLSTHLTSPSNHERAAAREAFGALWRLSDDSTVPASVLHDGALLVLDAVRSSDWAERQAGETWLRNHLRSYARIVDPLLVTLLDPNVKRVPSKIRCADIVVESFVYVRPFDAAIVNHALLSLLGLAKFGGQALVRATSSAILAHSPDPQLRARLECEGVLPPERERGTLLDALLGVLFRLLRSEPSDELRGTLGPPNAAIHANTVELLQILAARGALEAVPRLRDPAETLLIERTLVSVHEGGVDRQHKLLHALHTVIHASGAVGSDAASSAERAHRSGLKRFSANLLQHAHGHSREDTSSSDQGGAQGVPSSSSRVHAAQNAPHYLPQPHPLLLRLLRDGLSDPKTRPVLQHWTDFVLQTVPSYSRSVGTFLLPLNQTCLVLLERGVDSVLLANAGGQGGERGTSSDTELMLLINVSERLLMLCLGEEGASNGSAQAAEESLLLMTPPQPPPSALLATKETDGRQPTKEEGPITSPAGASAATSGLLNYVSNVFGADASLSAQTSSAAAQTTSATLRSLHESIRTLCRLWSGLERARSAGATPGRQADDARRAAVEAVAGRVQNRCRRTLERLYRLRSGEVVEALVDGWDASRDNQDTSQEAITFTILSLLAPSAQIVVTFLCDILTTRGLSTNGTNDRIRGATGVTVPDGVLFSFLDAYMGRLDGPAVAQVWPVVNLLVKEVVTNSTARKAQVFPLFRCLTTTGEKLAGTPAFEDRRLRRDLQENYIKLFDLVVLIAGRSFDSSTWMRRGGRDVDGAVGTDVDPAGDEKLALSVGDLAAATASAGGATSLVDSINDFLADRSLPALRKFGLDNDKINSACSNVVYYILANALRTKSKALEIDAHVMHLAAEMTKLPGTLKSWRTPFSDGFFDARFFNMTVAAQVPWRRIVLALMSTDKERFLELLGRITAAPSANIFTNRELEMLARALNLRRLSFVISAGERDQFLAQLPAIQEKVVDILRGNVADLVHAEVYLCMRVLVTRFAGQHLASFWPVIITEMMRLFEACIEELPADGSDHLHLILSACKFLDLLLTLQVDDFQIHQWMFVTDTVDAMYPPDDFMSESTVDRLAAAIAERRSPPTPITLDSRRASSTLRGSGPAADLLPVAREAGAVLKRRPLLASVREVKSIDELAPFFASVGIAAYEGAYGGGDVDREEVEKGIVRDMFESG